jgi:hypothetical protein
MAKSSKGTSDAPRFKSSLSSGAERFLAIMVVRALDDGWRTPDDFLRIFPPQLLMQSLAAADSLRAQLLIQAAGVHERIARKKSISSGAEDLQIALDEGITDAAAILELVPPDERVRYLDPKLLWKFVTEDEFWKAYGAEPERIAARRLLFIVESALDQTMITIQDVTDGLSFEEISSRLNEADLRRIVKHALESARSGRPLDESSLLEVVSLSRLLEMIPLEHSWERLILDKIARPAGMAGVASGAVDLAAAATPGPAPAVVKPQHPNKKKAEAAASPAAAIATPVPGAEPIAEEPRASLPSIDEEVAPLPESGRAPHEEQARRRVTERLRTVDRLPPSHETLSLPILLSIESMYAELLTFTNDEQREACIRESFPNENHLRTALLALIELLDPNIDTRDPVIRDGDIDSLIKVVLFEERQRYEQGRNVGRGSMSSIPAAGGPVGLRRASVPTPPGARRSSVVPPPTRSGSSAGIEIEVDDDAIAKLR